MNSSIQVRLRSALEVYFFAIVIFVALLSLTAVTLLSLALFTPSNVLWGALVSLLVALLFCARYRPTQKIRASEWFVVGLVLVAFALRSNTAIDIHGGQDPGVYTNIASHFAKNGTWVIKDPLLDELRDRPDIHEYYVANTLRQTTAHPVSGWQGNMLPGVYVQDRDKNEWVAQFYHVNTLWLAIGEWLFGQEWKGIPLAVLSSLTIIAAYLLSVRISGSPGAGVAAAFLLATNAAHSYIGTSPVSEAVAGFFFLSALAMLTAGYHISSVLPFAALFLTRITGFLTAPLILISLAWMVLKRRDVRAAWAGLGILCAYGLSAMWGLTFSSPYSRDIYRGKLGITSMLLENSATTFTIGGLLWIALCLISLRHHLRLKRACTYLLTYRTHITIGILTLILCTIAYRGYLLGFTDHYTQNRWLGLRWKMAARGIDSLRYLSFYSLTLMLSPIGLIAFLIGLTLLCRSAFRRATLAPIAICALGFFAALTVKQLTTPYLYYFGRYLVSELLPLAIICAVIALHALTRYSKRLRYLIVPAYCVAVFALLYPSLSARLRFREGRQFFEAMSCLNEATPGKSVILIDKGDFAEVPIVTALRFSFDKPTFAVRASDFGESGKLKDLVPYLRAKGFTVYLLSANDSWRSIEGFTKVFRIPAIMRKVSARGAAPTNTHKVLYPIRLYALETPSTMPEICKQVREYFK